MTIKIGRHQFNSEALSSFTEDEFRDGFKGKVDLELACKLMQNHFKKDVQEPQTSSKKRKKSKNKGNISDSL